ncbi:hypothetical protein BKA62DRAFT_202123 [Auriculariales sp. MPI-PUGE-AT-0066]|nr:hypothetical protein BKA62DRAFT_202123 [Auriculariales sp. MPI-PUGE-AT-0066]
MASDDVAPPHVPQWLIPATSAALQLGGLLWTITYILILRRAWRDKTYSMPMVAHACNVGWELVYGLFIAKVKMEKTGFQVWLVFNLGLVYSFLKFGRNEWKHTPVIQRNLGLIFFALTAMMFGIHYSFARWWVDNNIGIERGKRYGDIQPGPDTTELGYWSALASQAVLGIAYVGQLLARWDNRGSDVYIWAARTIGTACGIYIHYGVRWWFWPEEHPYVVNPFSICLAAICLGADLVYGVLMAQIHTQRMRRESSRKSL